MAVDLMESKTQKPEVETLVTEPQTQEVSITTRDLSLWYGDFQALEPCHSISVRESLRVLLDRAVAAKQRCCGVSIASMSDMET